MLHWWLLPALVILFLAVVAFYVSVMCSGGSGIRTEGRTLLDKPIEDDDSTSPLL